MAPSLCRLRPASRELTKVYQGWTTIILHNVRLQIQESIGLGPTAKTAANDSTDPHFLTEPHESVECVELLQVM